MLLLLQVPPLVASVRLVVAPGHAVKVPVMAAGSGLIVTIAWTDGQPSIGVNVIVAVPALPPVTIPVDEPTDAWLELVDHVPLIGSVNVVVEPTQTVFVPEITEAMGLTVTIVVI